MKRFSKVFSLACLPLAGVVMGVSPAMAQQVTSLDTSTLVPALALPQGAQDQEVEKDLPGKVGVDPSSVRLLGEDANAKYSVAQAEEGRLICIIVQFRSEGAIGGSSCTVKEQFAQSGVRVGVQENGGHAVVTYLLPGDVDAGPVKVGDGLIGRYVSNLVVQPAGTENVKSLELHRLNSDVMYSFAELPLAIR